MFAFRLARQGLPMAVSIVGLLIVLLLVTNLGRAAQCSINSFTLSPDPPYTVGVEIRLQGSSNCSTIRFDINGNTIYEIGTTSDGAWWRTGSYASGTYDVCMLGRTSSSWDDAARNYKSVWLGGGPAPDPNQQGCRVNSFSVSPNSNPQGHNFSLSGSGICTGDTRAIRFLADGNVFYELGTSSVSATWNSQSVGNHTLCIQVTSGDWNNSSQTAQQCVQVSVTSAGSNPGTQVAVPTPAPQPTQAPQQQPTQQPQQPQQPSNPTPQPPQPNNPSAPCNSSKGLYVGAIAVVVTDGTRLRSGPSTNDSILVQMPRSAQISMVSGPSCGGGYVWWQSQYGGHTGWVAESNLILNGDPMPGGNQPQPTAQPNNPQPTQPPSSGNCPGAHSPTIGVGERGRVAYTNGDPSGLWNTPQGDVIGYMSEGTQFSVTGEPRCTTARRGHLWWASVRTDDGRSGWTAYGYTDGARWIEKVPGQQASGNGIHPNIELAILSLEPSCVAVQSAQLVTSAYRNTLAQCFSAISGFYIKPMTEAEVQRAYTIADVVVSCGVAPVTEVLHFYVQFKNTGSVALSVDSFTSETIADCIISLQDAF